MPAGRVLLFAPHPDDEVVGTGGILLLHRQQQDPVHVVVATDGALGDPEGRFAGQDLVAIRKAESVRGLAEIDVHDCTFWGFPEGHELSGADVERAVSAAVQELRARNPDVVYLPWRLDGHPDHHTLHHIVALALERVGFGGLALGYEVWNPMVPDVIVDVSPVFERKRRAMHRHESQLSYVPYDHCIGGLNAFRALVHMRGNGYGEALSLVRGVLPSTLAENA